jgi:Uma2 family endonuclease
MPVMSQPQKKLTYADVLLFPDDGKRHEIIDGVHYVTPCPNLPHQELLGRLHLAIGNFLATRRHLGRAILSPFDVVMSDHDVVEPDLLFVAADQQSVLTNANVQGPPALVVEILSPSTRRRDEGIKKRLFDQKGVREYWLVDPKHCRVSVYRRSADGSFPIVSILSAATDEQIETPLLPGFALTVSELFAEI